MALGSAQFIREVVMRSVSGPDTDDALPVLRYLLARSTSAADPGEEPGRTGWLEKRPRSTALRI
jgi:hypothetical protein